MGKTITQSEFLAACNNHKANKFIKLWYSTFWSTGTNMNIYTIILGIIFIVGNILGFITKALLFVLPPNIVLALVVSYGFIAVTWNNLRIKAIEKELGISEDDYGMYSTLYLNDDGSPKKNIKYMKKFSKEYSYLLYESLEEKVEDKLTDKYASLKRGILELLEKSVDNYEELVNVQNFINKYVEKPEGLEEFVEDGDIFNFYLKYQVDIDSLCQEKAFFDKIPRENNIYSLYTFVITGTKFAVVEIMKILETEIFTETKK